MGDTTLLKHFRDDKRKMGGIREIWRGRLVVERNDRGKGFHLKSNRI